MPRELVWIDQPRLRGWECSQCYWVFRPTRAPIGKTFDEVMRNFESHRDEEFASLHGAPAKTEILFTLALGLRFTLADVEFCEAHLGPQRSREEDALTIVENISSHQGRPQTIQQSRGAFTLITAR